MREYITTYLLAPLLHGFGLYETDRPSNDDENKLERDARKMPRTPVSPTKKIPYRSRTVSTTGGTRGRRG